jgi:hypothetical protein
MTRKVREIPYLLLPNWRAEWLTGDSAIRCGEVTMAAHTGMKRCISPYNRTCLMTLAR